MKKLTILALTCLLTFTQAPAQKDPSLQLREPDSLEWFKNAKFGMFIHWGLYSILAGSYNGHTLPDTTMAQGRSWYAEWVQQRLEVPDKVYQGLAKQFNPVHYDADQWVREAKNAGMRYIVITSKHHDGFALWDSEVSDFDIMNTPYRHDILADLVKACRKYGIKIGFYYSHWQDWEYPGGALPYWKPRVSDKDFDKYWHQKSLPQVKELIQKYDPDLLWFDTWDEECHITPARRDELIRMIRKLSPKCLINGRICYENPGDNIDFLEMHDNAYPEKTLQKPWQTPATMQHSWGYHAHDFHWKTAQQMLTYLVSNVSKGGNYLLNIGPMADGRFPAPAVRRLREMGAWLHANGECVYGAKPVTIQAPDGVCLTQRVINGQHYIYAFLAKSQSEVTLPLTGAVEATILETSQPVKTVLQGGQTTFSIDSQYVSPCDLKVIKIRMAK